MGDTGGRPVIPNLVRKPGAQPDQERDPDCSRRPREGHRDLLRDALTQRREADRPAALPAAGEQLRAAEHIADRAESLEIGLAGEVEPARLGRRRRRHEQRAHSDAIARLERRLRAASAHADLGRSGVALQPLDSRVAEQKALAAGAILHEQDGGLELVRTAILKHRRLDQLRAHARHREAEQKDQNAEQAWHAAEKRRGGQAPPQPEQKNASNEQTGRAEPDRGLNREREVHGDAGAEPDRQPKKPALALREQIAGEPGQEARRHGRAAGDAAHETEAGGMERAVRHRRVCARSRADV